MGWWEEDVHASCGLLKSRLTEVSPSMAACLGLCNLITSLLATQEENNWRIESCVNLEMAFIILKANKFNFLSTGCIKGIYLMLLEGSI